MTPWFVIETLLLALLFFASLLIAWRTLYPDSLRRARTDLALALLSPARPAWVKRLGRTLAPRPRPGMPGQGGGCGGCGGDSSKGDCG
jgi:hypothetical protein